MPLNGNTSDYVEGEATRVDRLHLISERMRLLFVGITRARMELLLSWNTGQKQKSTEALALIEIKDYLTFNRISHPTGGTIDQPGFCLQPKLPAGLSRMSAPFPAQVCAAHGLAGRRNG